MKKKWIKILATLFACATLALGFTACGEEEIGSSNTGGGTSIEQGSSDSSENTSDNNSGDSSSEQTHTHEYTATVTAPTCTTQGFTTYTCACGDDYIADYVNALNHEFTNYVSDNNAKCKVNGTETATCSRQGCNETDTRTEENSALEHDFKNYIPDNNATYTSDGTKTAICSRSGCNKTDTITDVGTKLQSGIWFKTLSVNGTDVYGKVSNSTETFSFINEVTAVGTAKYVVSLDIYGVQQVATKTIPLVVGDNKVYITEMVDDEPINVYTVTVRRRPMYDVTFNAKGGTSVQKQTIEEDFCATEPTTTRIGYTFKAWDYDFSMPITKPTAINASWTANNNTPYRVEYYLQNLENDEYTLETTENKTGTTDTLANAEIKTFTHFTHIETATDSGNINGYGSTVLKVYYTRDKYTIMFNGNGGMLVSGEQSQTVKYGGSVNAPTYERAGYTFDGYDKTNYTNISGSFTVTANWDIITYAIAYDLDGGTLVGNENPTQYTVETDTIVFNIPRKANYGFLGWYNDDEKIESIEKGDVGSLNLVAKWENALIVSNNQVKGVTTSAKATCYEIEVPDTVSAIYLGAFNGCVLLERLTIPFIGDSRDSSIFARHYPFGYIFGTNNYVGGNATTQYFCLTSGSSVTSETYYLPSTLKSVTVTGMGIFYGAFYNCSQLTSIEIPDSVTDIGDYAFYNCEGLTSITIPDGVTRIGDYAFYNCEGLTSITIPDGVTRIGDHVFYNCDGLTNVEIPDSVTDIGDSAFRDCDGLTSVEIPDGVTRIGNYAFYSCYSLTDVVIPGSVTSIGQFTFSYCSMLTSITIGDGVIFIGYYAFKHCIGLTSIIIPYSVTHIDSYAFYECYSLTIYCETESKPSDWSSSWNHGSCPVIWGYKKEN